MDHSGESGTGGLGARVGASVRAQRAARRMTAAELAEASGLSRTILSRIENGDGNPSIGTLWRISQALRVSLGALLGEEPAEPRTRVIRAGEGAPIGDPSGMVARLLHDDTAGRRTELYAIELPAGTARESGPHYAGVEEVVVIRTGRALVGPAGDDGGPPPELGPGDAIWFAADVPHGYAAQGAAACELLCWMLYPAAP